MPSHRGSSFDRPVAWALTAMLVIYCLLTAATYYKVSQSHVPEDVITGTYPTFPITSRKAIPVAEHFPGPAAIAKLQRTFPIHVGEDRESILHPGLLAMGPDAARGWPENLPQEMKVPMFFEDSHGWIYGGSIRQYLGGGQQLMTTEQAAAIGSRIMKEGGGSLETIYCSVASYRDPECTGTVEDLFERALYPERIRVAIIDQRTDGDPVCAQPRIPCSQDANQTLCKYEHLIDRTEVDARYACGPVFARHLGNRHYRGEYFAMQIDAHVRFTEHWDNDLVQFWYSAKNEMGVLTTYLSDINDSIDPVTHTSKHPSRPIMCASDYEGQGEYRHLRHGQQPEGEPMIKGQPTLHPFWAAGFSFARGHFVLQVPYDQYLPMVFQGEEISIGLRGFTYGYDYYTPERGVCFHMYAIKANEAKRKQVPLFWENGRMYSGVGMKSMRRLNTIIGMENYPRDQWVTGEEEKYGLGKVRDPNRFFEVFGIHVKEHRVEQHLCRFVGRPMMQVFLPALRKNGMGLDYDKIDYIFVDPDKNQKPITFNPPPPPPAKGEGEDEEEEEEEEAGEVEQE